MKKIIYCLLSALLFASCDEIACKFDKEKAAEAVEQIKATIIEQEVKGLPLFLQKYSDVHSVVIDSVVFLNNAEPYEGYIVTTWDFDKTVKTQRYSYKDSIARVKKTVYVPLDYVRHQSMEGYKWTSNWMEAYKQVTCKSYY